MPSYDVIQLSLQTNAAGVSPPTFAVLIGLFCAGTLAMTLIRRDIRNRSKQRSD